MESAEPQLNTVRLSLGRIGHWQRRAYLAFAAALVAIGALLLAKELGLLPTDAARTVGLTWPALGMLAGLWLLRAGRLAWQWKPAKFAIAHVDDITCGELKVVAGTTDVRVAALTQNGNLAVGQFASKSGPDLEESGQEARLTMSTASASPFMGGPWLAMLARGVPWSLDLESGVGHFDLSLRDLSVAYLRLRSTFGSVDLTLPAAGLVDMQLRLVLGDLTIHVPEGVEVRFTAIGGPLVNVSVDERRFINVAPGEWCTPLAAASANRCRLTLHLSAGDLQVL